MRLAARNTDKKRLEESIAEQPGNHILLEILAFVKSIDGRLKRLETKAEDCDATTNTTFVKEGIIDDTILNSNTEDRPGNNENQDIEEIIMVPTSNRFEILAVQETMTKASPLTPTTLYFTAILGADRGLPPPTSCDSKQTRCSCGRRFDDRTSNIDGRHLSRSKNVKCVSFPGTKVRRHLHLFALRLLKGSCIFCTVKRKTIRQKVELLSDCLTKDGCDAIIAAAPKSVLTE